MSSTIFKHCERCGKSLAYRASCTKYCLDCRKQVEKEQALIRKAYVEALKARDMIREAIRCSIPVDQPGASLWFMCPTCKSDKINDTDKFCRKCGQRLKEDSNV